MAILLAPASGAAALNLLLAPQPAPPSHFFSGVLEANYSICVVHLLSAAFGLRLWRMELPLPLLLHRLADQLATSVSQSGFAWVPGHAQLPARLSVADLALLVVSAAGVAQGAHNLARVLGPHPPKLPAEVCHLFSNRLGTADAK